MEHCDKTRNTVIRYTVVEDEIPPVNGISRVYGIRAGMYTDGKMFCESEVRDAFCSAEEAFEFEKLLAENGVEPCHLSEVIEDRLS